MWVLLFDWPTEHRWPTWTPFLSIIRFENGKLIKIKLQFPSEPPPRIYQNLFKGSLHSLLLAKRLIEAFVQSGALQKLTYKGTFTLSIVVTANTSEWRWKAPSAYVHEVGARRLRTTLLLLYKTRLHQNNETIRLSLTWLKQLFPSFLFDDIYLLKWRYPWIIVWERAGFACTNALGEWSGERNSIGKWVFQSTSK